MEPESIQAVAALQPGASPIGAVAPLNTPASRLGNVGDSISFGDMVTQGLQHVNTQLNASQVALQRLATGDVQNLHQVMIGLEESRLSFQLFMQVRNRMLEAYQDIMKMQI
ncbi:MAG: flagellar hook-basal body complex protein FliE [Pseudomonadota bacterium]|jgi:flagellar hook-basal body complex protein FliE